MDGKTRRNARARTARRATQRFLRERRRIRPRHRHRSASQSQSQSRSRSAGPTEDPEKILQELRMEIAMLEEKIKTAPTHGDVFALLLRIRELTEQADALEAVLR